MFEPPQISAESLRKMLHLIARDLDIDDIYESTNPVSLTRQIREKIKELEGKGREWQGKE